MNGTEVERQYRDMRILGIGGGTTEDLDRLGGKTIGVSGMTVLKSTSTRVVRAYAAAASAMTKNSMSCRSSSTRRWPAAA